MKIYHLTIAYNEKTEEIEYIQEEIEEAYEPSVENFIMELEDGYYDEADLAFLMASIDIAEA